MVIVVAGLTLAYRYYRGDLTPAVRVTVRTDRAGLLLDPGSHVDIRGVTVGTVAAVRSVDGRARIELALQPDRTPQIPVNTSAAIRPTTLFGAKHVELLLPQRPSPVPVRTGDEIAEVPTGPETDDVFESAMRLLTAVQPQKVDRTLTAVAGALDGRGRRLGDTVSRLDAYLGGLQPALDDLGEDVRLAGDVLPTYERLAPDLLTTLENAGVTGTTLTERRPAVHDVLTALRDTAGYGTALAYDAGLPLTRSVRDLSAPATTLDRYAAEFTCLVQGAERLSRLVRPALTEFHGAAIRTTVQRPVQPYRYPEDLPKVGADTGPACHGLPVVTRDEAMPHLDLDVGRSPFTGPFGSAR